MHKAVHSTLQSSSSGILLFQQQVNDSNHRRQAAVDVEEQRPQLQDIFEAAIDGNHV